MMESLAKDAAEGLILTSLLQSLRDGVVFWWLAHPLHPRDFPLDQVSPLLASPPPDSPSNSSVQIHRNRFSIMQRIHDMLRKLGQSGIIGTINQLNASDIYDMKNPFATVDLLWQILQARLLHHFSPASCPQLIWAVAASVSTHSTVGVGHLRPGEAFVLLWTNYHLEKAGSKRYHFSSILFYFRRVLNLNQDFRDGAVFAILMGRLQPQQSNQPLLRAVFEVNLDEEAGGVDDFNLKRNAFCIQNATDDLNFPFTLSVEELSRGNSRLVLIFLTWLFLKSPGFQHPFPTEENFARLLEQLRGLEDSRTELDSKLADADSATTKLKHQVFESTSALNIARCGEKNAVISLKCHLHTRDALAAILNDTIRSLNAHSEAHELIFFDANVRTISAFDNEGKRLVFKIPAPSTSSRFPSPAPATSCLQPPTPPSSPTMGSAESISSPTASFSQSSCTDDDSLKPCYGSHDSSAPCVTFDSRVLQSATSIQHHIHSLIAQNMNQLQQIQLLAAKMDEMTWLSQVMGDKVREFSTSMLSQHKDHK